MKKLFLIFLLIQFSVSAQDAPLVINAAIDGEKILGDVLGNIYIVRGTEIHKYDEKGNLCCTFSDKTNGDITSVDVRDPLRVLIFYKAFGIAKILDNKLAEQAEIDLRKLQLADPWMVCTSESQGLWAFDQATSRLYKFDGALQPVGLSNDLRQDINRSVNPVRMAETDYWLVMIDAQSLLVFDKMGNYFKPVPVGEGVEGLLLHDEWIYASEGKIMRLNIRSGKINESALPVVQAKDKISIIPGKIIYQDGRTLKVYVY
jgi:hypothetical protein